MPIKLKRLPAHIAEMARATIRGQASAKTNVYRPIICNNSLLIDSLVWCDLYLGGENVRH